MSDNPNAETAAETAPQDAPQPSETTSTTPADAATSIPGSEPARAESDAKEPDWKAQSRKHEDRWKTARDELAKAADERDSLKLTLDAMAAALGFGEEAEDPATIAERAKAERDQLDAELRSLRLERAAERAARQAGADVDALLDSRTFAKRLAGLDPAADDFSEALVDAVTQALETNPRLKASPAATRSVTDTTGSGDTNGQLSRAQLRSMSPEQIEEARKKGRLNALLKGAIS
jgi:hypothetical protein